MTSKKSGLFSFIPKPSSLARAESSLVFAILLILVFAMAARTPVDSDLYWHLRAGHDTLSTGQPVLTDTYSHTRAGTNWINHSWLAQVLLYSTWQFGGSVALSGLVAGLATLAIAFIYPQMDGHPLWRAFLLVLVVAVAALVWSPRPQMFSFTGFALLLLILQRARHQLHHAPPLWVLPFFLAVWGNLHGGYILGVMLLLAIIIGDLFNHLIGSDAPAVLPIPELKRLALGTGLAILALGINPNGTGVWLIPFQTVGVQSLQSLISEWASPDFHQVVQQPYLWLLLITVAALGFSRRRADAVDLLVFAIFAYWGLLARRNYGPFALVAAPIVSRYGWDALQDVWHINIARWRAWLARWRLFQHKSAPLPEQAQKIINTVLILFLLFAALLKWIAVSLPEFTRAAERTLFPAQAAAWIAQNRPEAVLFNEYNWGGYLIWTLSETPVFVDGRTDLFNDEILIPYAQASAGLPGWQQTFEHWHINLVLIPTGSPLGRELARNGWHAVYVDHLAAVWEKIP